MRIWTRTATAIALAMSVTTPVFAQDDANTAPATPAPSCSADEFRQMDFWVGDWIAEFPNGDGTTGTGTNRVTNDEYGDCVIFEHFATPGFNGMSVSTYHAPVGQWRQTWVDDQGGYFALVGGPVEGQSHEFELVNTRLSENAPYLRMTWEDITEDSFVWRWQNKASEDAEWADAWVINYRRAE